MRKVAFSAIVLLLLRGAYDVFVSGGCRGRYSGIMSGASIAYGDSTVSRPMRGFPAYAWSLLIYNLAVILWGALVRATGSGAGCGGSWPLCNGDVVPLNPQVSTMIEFVHRAMSGVALITVVILAVWAWRVYPAGHRARRWAMLSLVFMLTEALIGAALVLLGHVAKNESVGRVFSLSTHLINTFMLLASLALTAWWSQRGAEERPTKLTSQNKGQLGTGIVALVLVAMAGVITALGDTLFPAHSLREGIAEDFAATANFLIRLRVIHPALAVTTAVYLAVIALRQLRASAPGALRTLSTLLLGLLGTQVVVGTLTFLLKAPLAMQLAHLLVADGLWITLVLFTSERARIRA
jgi:heme a synthase